MPGQRRGRERAGRSNSQTKAQLPRSRALTSLTAVELLGSQGDDGASVQLRRGLAGSGSLDTALLSVFLQQLSQPHQVAVAKQSIGVQPPARPRKRTLIPQPLAAASSRQEENSPLE